MGDLNQGLQQAKSIQLAIRLGIHTGLVVIGEMGGAGRQEQLALGETPNIAARIQGLAAPNTVAISEATYRLVQGYFDCEALGEQTLRGVTQPLKVYRVLQESGARGRLDIAQPRGLTPLVGRESEITLLLINGVSLLETELSNRKTNHFMLVYFHAPPGQEIERRHRPRDAGAEVGPHAMAHFLAMEDRGEHRQHRFHQHPRVPGATRTDFHVGGIPGLGMESRIGQDNHLVVKLGNQRAENACRGRWQWHSPRHKSSPTGSG